MGIASQPESRPGPGSSTPPPPNIYFSFVLPCFCWASCPQNIFHDQYVIQKMLLDRSVAFELIEARWLTSAREISMTVGSSARAALMGAAVVLGSNVLASSAWADTMTFDLFASNMGAGFTGP